MPSLPQDAHLLQHTAIANTLHRSTEIWSLLSAYSSLMGVPQIIGHADQHAR